MTVFNLGQKVVLFFVLCASLSFFSSVGLAHGQSPAPGWAIDSVAEPTNFSAADAHDGVRVFGVRATGGTYRLSAHGGSTAGEQSEPIEWNESAEGLQKKLEAVPDFGVGNVAVSGGPGDENGTKPYAVTFVGSLSGNNVSFLANAVALTGGEHTVRINEPPYEDIRAEARDRYQLSIINIGSRTSEGEVTAADKLPPGLVPVSMEIIEPRSKKPGECSVAQVECTYPNPVPPGHELVVELDVAVVSPSLSGPLTNEATVSGGGAHETATSESTPVNVGSAPFGIAGFAFETTDSDGAPDLQAGGHPYALTTTLDLNTRLVSKSEAAVGLEQYLPTQEVKDVAVDLPLGVAGAPLAAERCPEVDLSSVEGSPGSGDLRTRCPAGSRVGTVRLVWEGGAHAEAGGSVPLYDVVPEHGYPAELGFNAGIIQPIFLYASIVPNAAGYRLRLATPGAIRAKSVEGISVTVFGDPAERDGTGSSSAFVTNPTRCSGEPLNVSAEVSSWEDGVATSESTAYPEVTGCDLLQGAAAFDPSIEVTPETTQADTPSGYEVNLRLPQQNVFGPLATPALKNATVTLPAGVSIDPGQASGPHALEGCTPAQIDLLGTEVGEGHPGGNGSPYDDGLTHASPGDCPEGSRIGTVSVTTPLLGEPLEGHVFLGQPSCGGAGQGECTEAAAEEGKVFGLYVEAAGSGVILKLPGSIEVGGYGQHSRETGLAPGQIRTRFLENPQMPFEDFKLVFPGGQRAPLANPQSCGTATATSDLEPWSAPESGANATPFSSFTTTGCAVPQGFAPGFLAGTLIPSAGGFAPFTMTLSRNDGEQNLGGVSVTMPPGVAGMLSKVPLCGEPQASAGTCSEASKIGTVNAAAGAGSEPLWLSGRVYLTGPYKGAPFGLSIVVPAVAGPFDLGNVVERAAISVNPTTAQVTVTAGPLQQSRDGVLFRLKELNVTIDREEFMFNPTNCSQLHVTGTVTGVLPNGSPGSSVGVSSPFAAAGCKNLPFTPKLTALTDAKTSKAGGAYLHVKVVSGPGQANIAKVKVDLPKQLPSRLSTLQKACLAAAFESNPASCPAASVVGTGTAVTPVLKRALTGPAYLVSHGGAAFPDLEIMLQGEGVTLVLDGGTDIKKGITSSTFNAVPDAPISTFDLVLGEGPHSALAANGNLCKQKLRMPTMITGQNGAVISTNTTVQVAGCPKPKKATGGASRRRRS